MKKKVLLILFCGVLILGMTGCGNEGKQTEKNNSGVTTKNSLASKVTIGDYVNYNAGKENSYSAKAEKTGYSKDQEFETTGEEKWRVLSIESDGTVNLILDGTVGTKYKKGFYLKGETGYTNAIEELNNISSIFGKGKNAIGARSLSEEDINKLLDVDVVAKEYENKYEVDITNLSTEEEKWEAINKAVNSYYGKEYTIGGTKRTINVGLKWASASNSFGFENVVKDMNIMDLLNCKNDNQVWLGNQKIEIEENNIQNAYRLDYGVAYYNVNTFSSYSYRGLYYELASRNDGTVSSTGDSEVACYLRPVVKLDKNTMYNNGTGTSEDPYILK